MSEIEKNAVLHDHQIKSRKVTLDLDIVADATPADIQYATDLPSVAVVRAEGQTSEADAIEDLSGDFTTAAAATGVLGLLLKSSEMGEIEKVYEVRVVSAAGTTTVAAATSAYVTPEGNIAIDIDSDQNHTTTDEKITLEVSYKIKTI
jgi:hypothetical protein